MSELGWIKLHRKILDSRVFQNPELFKVWVYCLCRANHKGKWVSVKTGRGQTEVYLERGQFLWGRKSAAKKLKMKPSSVRNRLEKLKKMLNVDTQPDTHYTIISVVNFDKYNVNEKKEDSEEDNQRTTKGQPKDTNKKGKKGKKEQPPREKSNNSEKLNSSKTPTYQTKEEPTPTIEEMKSRYTDQTLIDDCFSAIASTRTRGKVSVSILEKEMLRWADLPVSQVEAGIKIYIADKHYKAGKKENYLWGVIKGQKNGDGKEVEGGSFSGNYRGRYEDDYHRRPKEAKL